MAEIDWPDMKVSASTRALGWLRHALIGLMLLALVLPMVAVVDQAARTEQDRRNHPAPGFLVDVGGHRVHARVLGEGWPTVVFEAGLGGTGLDWSLVAPEVAALTRVVTYDRAGMGWSEAGPAPRSSERIASELGTLLENLGIGGPMIFVGHSVGAFHVRTFFHQRPEDVAGMVLVDGSHEDQIERLPDEVSRGLNWMRVANRMAEAASYFGLMRAAIAWFGEDALPNMYAPLPAETKAHLLTFFARPNTYRTMALEYASFDESAEALRARKERLGRIPLTVLSAGRSHFAGSRPAEFSPKEYHEIWMRLQADLGSLSDRSRRVMAGQSGHYVQLSEPALVVEAVRRMVVQVRRDFVWALEGAPRDGGAVQPPMRQ